MSILEKYMCVFTCVLEYAPPKQRITLIKCSNDEFSLSSFQNFAKKEKKASEKIDLSFRKWKPPMKWSLKSNGSNGNNWKNGGSKEINKTKGCIYFIDYNR